MFRTEELSETCRVSRQNKYVNLVHLLGFIIKKSLSQALPLRHCIITIRTVATIRQGLYLGMMVVISGVV